MIVFTKKTSTSKKINKITLDFHQRSKRKMKIILKNGEKAFLFLRNFSILRHKDIISNEEENKFIKIIAANEKLSEAFSEKVFLLLKASYYLGNRHILLQIKRNKLIYYYDPVLDQMLIKLGLLINHIYAPFDPESGAYHH